MIVLLLILLALPAAAEKVSETLVFLEEDGKHALVYGTTRSHYSTCNQFMDKRITLADYYHIYPNHYEWDDSGDKQNILRFSQGNLATMRRAFRLCVGGAEEHRGAQLGVQSRRRVGAAEQYAVLVWQRCERHCIHHQVPAEERREFPESGQSLEGEGGVELLQSEAGVQVILGDTILFASGSADLTTGGSGGRAHGQRADPGRAGEEVPE